MSALSSRARRGACYPERARRAARHAWRTEIAWSLIITCTSPFFAPAPIAFFDSVLQRVMRQRQLRIHPLQPSILGLQLFEPSQLRYFHATAASSPVVQRRFADTMLARQLRRFHASLELLQDRNDLLFGKPGLLHFEFSPRENSTPQWS